MSGIRASRPQLLRNVVTVDAGARLRAALLALHLPETQLRVAVCSRGCPFAGSVDAAAHVRVAASSALHHVLGGDAATDPLSSVDDAVFYLSQVSLTGSDVELPPAAVDAIASALGGLPPEVVVASAAELVGLEARLLGASLWANACGVVTTLHYDASENFLLVLSGSKRVILLPPSAAHALSSSPLTDASPNHSRVTLWSPHAGDDDVDTTAPMWGSLPPSLAAAAIDITLRSGDALFLPDGWFHTVVSSPHTLAVSFAYAGSRHASAARAGVEGVAHLARCAVLSLVHAKAAETRSSLSVDASLLLQQTHPHLFVEEGGGVGTNEAAAITLARSCALRASLELLSGGGDSATGDTVCRLLRVVAGDGRASTALLQGALTIEPGAGGAAHAARLSRVLFQGTAGGWGGLDAMTLDCLAAGWEGVVTSGEEETLFFSRLWADAFAGAGGGSCAMGHIAAARRAMQEQCVKHVLREDLLLPHGGEGS